MFVSKATGKGPEAGFSLIDDLEFSTDPKLDPANSWIYSWEPGDPIPDVPSVALPVPDVISKETVEKAKSAGGLTPEEYKLISQAIDTVGVMTPALVEIILKATQSAEASDAEGGGAEGATGATGAAASTVPWTPILAVGGALLAAAFLARKDKG